MSALDIIELPGQPGRYGRRILVDAWQEAGSPPVNSAGRLYADQKYYWDGWVARLPGFNPADNPDDETQRLAHVRFGALDIDPTPERIRRLSAAGLIRPYSYEPWHWELPNIRSYPIVRAIPGTGDDMSEKAEKQIQAIHDAIFRGGNSMPDSKKSIGQSLAEIQEKVGPIFRTGGPVTLRQEIADTKTQVYALKAAVTALATANGADPAAILTAVERGVKDAMRDVSFVADVTGIKR